MEELYNNLKKSIATTKKLLNNAKMSIKMIEELYNDLKKFANIIKHDCNDISRKRTISETIDYAKGNLKEALGLRKR
jgi:archaellum component FlaC